MNSKALFFRLSLSFSGVDTFGVEIYKFEYRINEKKLLSFLLGFSVYVHFNCVLGENASQRKEMYFISFELPGLFSEATSAPSVRETHYSVCNVNGLEFARGQQIMLLEQCKTCQCMSDGNPVSSI